MSTPSPAACRFFFAAWSELFEEVAKFRVARRMWATIMSERFGAKDPRSMVCRFHVQTAGSSLTAQSVDNNVVRTTIQALAAVLGGAQSLHTNSRDEALALPDRGSRPSRAADPADPGLRGRRDRDARPAGGLLLRREPDQRARGGRLGVSRRDRDDGRHAGRDRGRLPAAPDPGGRLPRPAGDRVGRPGRRRGQPLPRRRGHDPGPPPDRPGRGAAPGRARPAGPGRALRGGLDGARWTGWRRSPGATAT